MPYIAGIAKRTNIDGNDVITDYNHEKFFAHYETALNAAKKLKEKYPDDEIIVTADNYKNQSDELFVLWSSEDTAYLKNRYFVHSDYNWNNCLKWMNNTRSDIPGSVYFDMDGVLCRWHEDMLGYSSLEEILCPTNHYFLKTEPQKFAIELANKLCDEDVDVCIISASVRETIRDKARWIETHMPFIKEENIFFAPLNTDKKYFVKSNAENSILIDDYSKNLKMWPGKAVKAYNEVNSHQDEYPEIRVSGCLNRPEDMFYIDEAVKYIKSVLRTGA